MRLIDADFLEKEGWWLHRVYQKDKATMVYEVKPISEINTAQPEHKNRLISEIEGKTPEETYDFLAWLLLDYGMQFTDTRQAIIQWLASQPDCGEERKNG